MPLYNRFSLKRILLLGLLVFVIKSNAQPYYYSTSYHTNSGNPGVFNTESDNITFGWLTLIEGSQFGNSWSSINPIPAGFDFDFFGVQVTNAKISGNGVLTFDTAVTAIPSSMNTNLPAIGSNIPDYSILGFWDSFTGDGLTGSNDSVEYKVFGTAPNRQVWFKYSSYEYGDNGSGGALISAYWAIVLEETTDKVYVVDMNFGGSNLLATIGVQENSSRAIQYGSNNINMNYSVNGHFASNNDYYMFTPFILDSNNIAVLESDIIPNPYSAGIQNVDVFIKNVGANPITSVNVNWRINGVLQTPYNYTGNLDFNDSTAVTIGTYNFISGSSNIEIWTSMPNGVTDGDMTNDSIQMDVCTGLSGTYTIGLGGNYSTIDSAANDLNNCGILGPVTFNILPGTYNGSVLFEEIPGASSTNTITFDGGNADNVSIIYNGLGASKSVITLNGADYIAIKNITIQNTNLTSGGRGIFLTNEADYNTIDSCIIIVNSISSSSSYAPIVASASAIYSVSAVGNNANFTTISNCEIKGGYYGIILVGSSSATPDNSSNRILNCDITDVYYYGIYLNHQDSPIVSGNSVAMPRNTNFSYSCRVSGKQPEITKNIFLGAKTTGLYLLDCNTLSQSFTQNGLVANNMIRTSGASEGLYLNGSDYINIFHNTIVSENESALWVTSNSNFLDIRNNVFVTEINSSSVPAVDFDSNPNGTSVIDYNIYDAPLIALMGSSSYSSLANWVVAEPTLNINSIEGNPGFITTNDLHLAGSIAESAGTTITLVPEDIDGDTRSITMPDIGADEYAFCPSPSGVSNTNINPNSSLVNWIAGGSELTWNIEYGIGGFTLGLGTQIMGQTATNYTLNSLIANTTYDIYIQADCGGSQSYWTGPFTFTSACQAFLAPYTESFVSSSTPLCWSQSSTIGGPWEFASFSGSFTPCGNMFDHTTNLTSKYAYVNQAGADAGVILTMNTIDIAALTTPFLEFYYSQCDLNMTIMNSLYVEAWDGTVWQQVGLIEDATDGDWKFYEFNLSNYVFNSDFVKVRFRAESGGDINDDNGNILIDDVSVLEAPTCAMPTALNANILNSSTIEFSWVAQGSESEWTIEYGTAGFPLGSGTQVNSVMSNTDTISGFLVNTAYEYYVKADCSSGNSSLWAGPFPYLFEYCTPTPTSSTGASITEVIMGSINNSTGTESGYYADYTYLSTDVNQGGLQEFYIKFTTASSSGVNIWVDWNNDLVFNNTTELVYSGVSASTFPFDLSATFIVPPAAVLGSHILRIGGAQQFSGPGNPCYSSSNATFEDYNINVVPACIVSVSDIQTACNSFIWQDGVTYNSSNSIATDTIFSVNGGTCDTIFTLNLTINHSVYGVDAQVACDAYTWIDGITYYSSNNTAKDTLQAANGCDSIITLNLTIHNSIATTDTQVACDTYTWINGVSYTTSNNTATHTLTRVNGCDSIVSLNLMINNTVEVIDIISDCSSHTWIDGNTYTTNNTTATQTYIMANGCDSIVTLALTINTPSSSTINETICGEYTAPSGTVYTSSGTYTDIIPNVFGCDSVITINLSQTNIELSVTQTNGIDLMSNQAGATYQWLDCGLGFIQIGGANGQSYSAILNGIYAVEVSYQGCTDTSACYYVANVGLNEVDQTDFEAYPNPVSDVLTVALSGLNNAQFDLIDIQGKTIITSRTISNGEEIQVGHLESGTYFVRISSDENQMVKRIVKY